MFAGTYKYTARTRVTLPTPPVIRVHHRPRGTGEFLYRRQEYQPSMAEGTGNDSSQPWRSSDPDLIDMTPAEMAAWNTSPTAGCSSLTPPPLTHTSPAPAPAQSTPTPASDPGLVATPPLIFPSRPSIDTDPVSPVANSPVEGDPPPGSKQVTTEQHASLTVRILLHSQACWTHCLPAPVSMTVFRVWADIALFMSMDPGCISHACCRGQPVQAHQSLAELANEQAVQLDFVLHPQGPHLMQLSLRDCKQAVVTAAFLSWEVLGSALQRWAHNMNLTFSHLHFSHQGQPLDLSRKVQDLANNDGIMLDVAVVPPSPSVTGCGASDNKVNGLPLIVPLLSSHATACLIDIKCLLWRLSCL